MRERAPEELATVKLYSARFVPGGIGRGYLIGTRNFRSSRNSDPGVTAITSK